MDIFKLTPNNIHLLRPSLYEYLKEGPHVFKELSSHVLDSLAAGKIKAQIFGEWPLAEAAKAHTALQSRGTTGKLLLRP